MGGRMSRAIRGAALALALAGVLAGCSNPLFDALILLRMKLADGGTGKLDSSFDPKDGVRLTFLPGTVRAVSLQGDQKILIGGNFDMYDISLRLNLARLLPGGSIDAAFTMGAMGPVRAVVVQPDEKILIGGDFLTPSPNIARFETGGSIDTTFFPVVAGQVVGMIVQSDGKILINGDFNTIGGMPHPYIGRLTATGALDSTFDGGFNWSVAWVAEQPDGKLIAVGWFNQHNGVPCSTGVVRLGPNGALDTAFNFAGIGTDLWVNAGALQSDGKILIGGAFAMYNGTATPYLARLNADGTLDATFHRGGAGMNGPIMSMALQQNGKILIGGYFTKYDNVNCNGLARLHPDGTLDGSFDTSKGIGAGAPNTIGVYAIVVQPDGRILVGGDFVEYDDAPRVGIARIWGD